MGGPGSGTWDRWHRRPTLNDALAFDVRRLKREGFLRAGQEFKWGWKLSDRQTVRMNVRAEPDQIILDYYHYAPGRGLEYVVETVPLTRTDCTYGGTRVWFLCPGCRQRAAKLYRIDRRFRCRRCHRMPYRSQCETELSRANRKARRLRENLGGSANPDLPHGPKPKGMHEQTFERLTEEIYEAMGHAEDLFSESCRKFMARYP